MVELWERGNPFPIIQFFSGLTKAVQTSNLSFAKSKTESMLDYVNTQVPKKVPPINNSLSDRENIVQPTGEKTIPLLEERVVVDYKKQKLGEVIVRKQIETRHIQVPVRIEKLIVEQVGAENKLLAEIVLNRGEVSGVDLTNQESEDNEGSLIVCGEFNSPEIVSLLLNAIALDSHHGCKRVKVELTVENQLQQQKCQEWINRFSLAS
jgi:hypothetical protein